MGNLYMLKPNETYVIEEDGSIHRMRFCGDADWEESATTSVQEIKNKIIDDFTEALRLKCIEDPYGDVSMSQIFKIAAQMKGE